MSPRRPRHPVPDISTYVCKAELWAPKNTVQRCDACGLHTAPLRQDDLSPLVEVILMDVRLPDGIGTARTSLCRACWRVALPKINDAVYPLSK